jgi:phosphoribosyl 1,2-cyclic phosphate phosphodiesterase
VKLTLLGCGTSSGVPRIGNDWGDCDPNEPKNRRRRVSILVEHEGVRILVDTGPDMREQLLDADVDRIDAVIWTHDHADHCHGIDDLRQLFHAQGEAIKGYARPQTLRTLKGRFPYVFHGNDGYPPTVRLHELPDQLRFGALTVRVVDQPHGSITSAGLRFEVDGRAIAYSTDFNALTEEMQFLYEGVDLWIVDALRRRPHPSHPHLGQALGWIASVHPARAILTHMDQSMDYAGLVAELPAGVEPGYDGLEVEL